MSEIVHNVSISSCSIADVVQRFSLNWDVGGVDSSSSGGGELSSLKLPVVELAVASEVAAIIKVDVGVPAGAVDAVVSLLGSEFDIARPHK